MCEAVAFSFEAESKFRLVGRGSVGGVSCIVSASADGQLASMSCSFLRSFLAIGEPGAKARVLPERLMCIGSSVRAASSALPMSIQL